ncbi:MAG TPA: hypothetical protein VL381_04265 [Rhodocyclaceae bacterium]|nr:hypothetical protein [Rhodocyclaceae bacterium]
MNPSYQPPDKRPDDIPKGLCAVEHRLPRISEKLCFHWATTEFEPFVASLMMDSRDGSRQGLPWDVAQELLFLLEISIAKRAIIASQSTGLPYRDVFKSMRTNAEEAAKNTAGTWNNPTLNNDSRRVGPALDPSLAVKPSLHRGRAKPVRKSWWQRLIGG